MFHSYQTNENVNKYSGIVLLAFDDDDDRIGHISEISGSESSDNNILDEFP